MYKFAQQTKIAEQAKNAEVRGAMAAFVDHGLVKVASQESFDELCDVVSANLDFDYDLNKIAAVTEAVLNGQQPLQKTAAQQKLAHETARNAALGELLLMKTAGQIDDATFVKEAKWLMKEAAQDVDAYVAAMEAEGRKVPGSMKRKMQMKELAEAEGRNVTGKDFKVQTGGGSYVSASKAAKPSMGSKLLGFAGRHKKALIGGAGLAGLAGAGVLGKQLYDKYNAA